MMAPAAFTVTVPVAFVAGIFAGFVLTMLIRWMFIFLDELIDAVRRNPRAEWTDHGGYSSRPMNSVPQARPGETEADTIERLLKQARDK
jgi:hypothetical protein